MLQFESPSYPHTLAQWLYVVVAAFLASGTTWLGLWTKRRHGPAEVRKIDAETRSILVRDDIALGDSVTRLIKEVSQAALDAEQRRQEHLLREDQLRTQILFWRNKSEELDGQLADAQETVWRLEGQATLDNHHIRKQAAFIEARGLKDAYIALDTPKS